MLVVKRILTGAWSTWGILVFLTTLMGFAPMYLLTLGLGGRKGQQQAHLISRVWARILFAAFGIHIRVQGSGQLEPGKPYILVANHTSQLDIPAMTIATSHFFKFLAKEELTRIPLLGRIIKQMHLTVDRADPKARAYSLAIMQEALQDKTSVALFPEGSRNQTPKPLLRFHDGAFTLSELTGYPIAVLTIVGTAQRLPARHCFGLNPGKVDCYWEGVLEPDNYDEGDLASMKQDARKLMLQRLRPEEAEATPAATVQDKSLG